MFDVLIIGAGITGSLIARELSRYNLKVIVLEKSNDVGNKTTSANSAIVHSGYDPIPGTLKAKFNVLGNALFDTLAKELNVPFFRIGSLTVALEDSQISILKDLEERSRQNGVDVRLLNKEETIETEPNITSEVKGSLLAPSCGIIDPFLLCVRAMENAVDNGVCLSLNEEVKSIKKQADHYKVFTKNHCFEATIVINCAGNYADKIASMVEEVDWSITPKKGEYFVLDHFMYGFTKHTIFPLPTAKGKGVLFTSTTSGNYLIGPSNDPINDKDDYSTNEQTLENIKKQALQMVPSIPFNKVIRTFAGLRPSSSRHDFIIEYSRNDKFFINVAGIESPGLASSPAIAKYVVEDLISPIMELKAKSDFNPFVKRYIRLFDLMNNGETDFVKEHPEYGEIICNCEKVTVGEINDVLSRSVPPHSVKGVKRRTRAGFGKCQGGFCQPKIVLLLARHYGISPLDVPLDEYGSNILVSKVKEYK